MDSEIEKLKLRLKGMYDYHIEKYSQNLKEVGGPGVGGLEPKYHPHSITKAETKDEMRLMALEQSISHLWNEATMCFVHNQFRACILLLATLTEAVLKLEIEKKNKECATCLNRMTLGGLINFSSKKLKLSKNIINILQEINTIRNEVVHLNRERNRPESMFNYTEEDEIKPIKSSKIIKDDAIAGNGETISFTLGKSKLGYNRLGYNVVYLYKNAARKILKNVEELLKSLYG